MFWTVFSVSRDCCCTPPVPTMPSTRTVLTLAGGGWSGLRIPGESKTRLKKRSYMKLHSSAHLNPGTKEETQGLPSTWWQDQEAQHREFWGIRLNLKPHQKGTNFRPRRVLNVSLWKQTFFVKHHHRINLPHMKDLWDLKTSETQR